MFSKTTKLESTDIAPKIEKILFMALLAHTTYLIAFLALNIYQLALFNILSICIFIYCIYLSKINMISRAFFIAHIEILCHASLCIISFGWAYGFDVIIIALISASTYINVFDKKNTALKLTIFESIIYVILYFGTPQYTDFYPRQYANSLFILNLIFLIMMLVTISNILKIIDIINIHSIKNSANNLKNMSERDYLTGLINKRTLEAILNNKKSISMVIAICDIDNFKKINDMYGHNIGDEVLKKVAEAFKNNTNKKDVVCRWGGEEFVIVSFNIPRSEFLHKIQNIKTQINKEFINVKNQTVNFTMTYGISDIGNDKISLIKQADERLYKGKRTTKNCIVLK